MEALEKHNTSGAAVQSGPSLWVRLQDGQRWRAVGYDMLLWFMASVLVTTLLGRLAPGYPILVATDSIKTGLYWLDQRVTTFKQGDYVTFDFKPQANWLKERYDKEHRIHTKQVLGVEGDTVHADAELNLTLCPAKNQVAQQLPTADCWSAGKVRTVDSKGRQMTSWVPAGTSYTLQRGEIWIYGPNPLSLDSRYQGPVQSEIVKGQALPIWLFAIH